MMEKSADGQDTAVVATYTWDGIALSKREDVDEAWYCRNHVCDVEQKPDGGTPQTGEQGSGDPIAQPRSAVESEVQLALENWALAMRSNDPDRISQCYADRVDRYFLRQNWDRDTIRNYMTRWFQAGAKRIDGFEISMVDFQLETDNSAVVTIVKDLTISDPSGVHERMIRSELHLDRTQSGQWLITSERDFK